jgi:Peptidase propeptide and YPEB domain
VCHLRDSWLDVNVGVIIARYRCGMISWKNITACAFAAALTLTVTSALAYPGEQFASQANVSIVEARKIALKAVPGGTITGEELEKELGGSGLRYSFDVKVGGKTREVGVDAKTGKVLENSVEGKNPD